MSRLECESDEYIHTSHRPGYEGMCLVYPEIPDRLLPELAYLDIMKRVEGSNLFGTNYDCHLIAERYIPVLKKVLEEEGYTAEELQIDFKW